MEQVDIEALSDAIALVHTAADRDAFASIAVEAVGRCVDTDVTSYNEIDPVVGRIHYLMQPDTVDFAHANERFVQYAEYHPIIRYVQETGDGSAHRLSDFLDRDALRSNPMYMHVYARMGIGSQITISLPAAAPLVIGVALSRFDDAPDFSERDRAMLNLLRPHLAQSYTLSRDRERVRSALAAATDALAIDAAHVVLLDNPLRDVTPGALTALYRAFGPPGDRDPLPPRVGRWVARQHARTSETGPRVVPDLFQPITAERPSGRIVMRFIPGDPLDSLVLRTELPAAGLQELRTLGLTDREAEVLGEAASGATNAAIAAALHIESSTVKTHLEHIYRKLGARGRVQAVAMALDLLTPDIGRTAD